MKTIFKQFLNQQNAIEGKGIAIESGFKWIKESPIFLLWLLWLLYLMLDFVVRLYGSYQIAPLQIIFLNFLGWGLINQFWFTVFLPNIIFMKKWKLETFILIFAIYACLKIFSLSKWMGIDPQIPSFLVNESVRSLQFLLYTSAIWGFYVLAVRQDSFKKLEIDLIKLQIEHKSLQLNPHFVLNMISQFSAAILKESRSLHREFSLFTEILSYSYKDHQKHNFLDQEIRSLENYIKCQKYRFGEKLQFLIIKNFSEIQPNVLPISKWTLMTLLENVFKHGNCYNPTFPCTMSLNLISEPEGTLFSFSLTNALENSPPEMSSEFGIEAVSRILNYYFPGNFQLFHGKSSTEFNLLLYICYGGYVKDRTPR